MIYDIIIIGGGASGLFAAINCKRPDNSVLILDHQDRLGKKILQTGNGRCNLTNSFCRPHLLDKNPEGLYPYYTSGNRNFIESVISNFDAADTVIYFESLGVLTEDKGGYIYPRSEQASTINNILRYTCNQKGVHTETNVHVSSISIADDNHEYRFIINDRYFCRKIVIAAGGMSAKKTGSDGSIMNVLEGLGHTVVRQLPALCPVNCSDRFFKELAGVRNDSELTLAAPDNEVILKSHGNIQFTKDGISGIPVFQLSSVIARMMDMKAEFCLYIDFLPDIKSEELVNFIGSYCKYNKAEELPMILNSKLLNVLSRILKAQKYTANTTFADRAASLIKHFPVNAVSTGPFESAQTTSGGISTSEIDPSTMESRFIKGLYFTGEIIDVDGICGGYNLQWAWSSAHVAAENI